MENNDMNQVGKHIPVLLNEAIENLNIKPNGIYVDCTLGGAGHSSVILSKLKEGHLYGFDQDPYAIERSTKKLSEISDHFTIIENNFANVYSELSLKNVDKVDGILYDLGVSSFQFDFPERGFSYRMDGPLDMRMDTSASLTAKQVVNTYSEEELKRILFEYGEEKFAGKIAHKIVMERAKKQVETTFELVDIIKAALPAFALRGPHHPAKKSFQAIRIEVNHELDVLASSLQQSLDLLAVGGRVVVISFQSLEDKIVKKIFQKSATVQLPPDMPYIPEGFEAKFELVNHKVIVPTEKELEINPRSHSAKMRVITRIKE
jgi:16S rRNA (cytosine1402-N4)-methyltransferase